MNQELHDLFVADQADRADHPAYDTTEYWQLHECDAKRRQRVNELLNEGELTAPDDYFHAALIFQHGETLEDIWLAHELSQRAAEMGATQAMGYKDSRWLAAATLDRWLMYQGKPQKYGTQFVPDGKRWRLWDIDPNTTDAERIANHVPSLQEQMKQAERYTQELDQPPREKAPDWMKEALERWEREDAKVALVTGGSRGIGAATALALAQHRYDVALTYRNKEARANEVVSTITSYNVRGLARPCDLTRSGDITQFFEQLKQWTNHLDILVLNASGGLEKDLVATDPEYPMHINRDAQLAFTDAALPLMHPGSTLIFVTSHWASLYGQIEQIPAYEPVAASKHAGEQALRSRQSEFDAQGIRLIVVTGDLIEGTITPKLLERMAPGLISRRRNTTGALPTATEMGETIASVAIDASLASGSTIVVGEPLQAMLTRQLS